MEKLDTNTLKTPLDIPVGTILTQHWCNSTSFYKIVGRTEKSVLVVEVPSKHTRFEHEGGGTGYQYKLPDEERLAVLEKKIQPYVNWLHNDVIPLQPSLKTLWRLLQ